MMNPSEKQAAQTSAPEDAVSALTDGELSGAALTAALSHLREDSLARQRWQTYHVIGEALRSPEAVAPPAECAALLAGLRQRLWAAPDLGVQGVREADPVVWSRAGDEMTREAANDSQFRWKLVAGLASVATVMVGAWALMASQAPVPPAGMAAASPVTTTTASAGPMLRDRQLDELLAAHRQRGGSSALQNPAGFLRNATYTVGAP